VVDLLLGAGVPLPGTAERSPWAEELIHGAAEAAAEKESRSAIAKLTHAPFEIARSVFGAKK